MLAIFRRHHANDSRIVSRTAVDVDLTRPATSADRGEEPHDAGREPGAMSRGPVAVRAESERLRQESAGLIRSAKAACERAQLLFRTIETRFRTSRLIRPAAIPAGGEADGPARSEGRIP